MQCTGNDLLYKEMLQFFQSNTIPDLTDMAYRHNKQPSFVISYWEYHIIRPYNPNWTSKNDEELYNAVRRNNNGGTIDWDTVALIFPHINKCFLFHRYHTVLVHKHFARRSVPFAHKPVRSSCRKTVADWWREQQI